MKNLAGHPDPDDTVLEELRQAKITAHRLDRPQINSEVQTYYQGRLLSWRFVRHWYYYVAEGPELPFELADPLHDHLGQEVRVGGHCGAPAPRDYYRGLPGVDCYHVDSQLGLYLLAETIKKAFGPSERL